MILTKKNQLRELLNVSGEAAAGRTVCDKVTGCAFHWRLDIFKTQNTLSVVKLVY